MAAGNAINLDYVTTDYLIHSFFTKISCFIIIIIDMTNVTLLSIYITFINTNIQNVYLAPSPLAGGVTYNTLVVSTLLLLLLLLFSNCKDFAVLGSALRGLRVL